MKITSEQHKGNRMFKSVTCMIDGRKFKRPFFIEPIGPNWWYDITNDEWAEGYVQGAHMSTSYYSGYSIKSVKRKISKWNVPKGTKFKVLLPFVKYSFIITK